MIAAWISVSVRRPCSRLHPELLCGALVDTDNDDVRRGCDRATKREQPPEAELFFQPYAKAGRAQQPSQRADEETEQDALRNLTRGL